MRNVLLFATTGTFAALGALHLYWAGGGRFGAGAAVPQVGGAAAFAPSAAGTVAVAIALFAAALVVALAGGALRLPVPSWIGTLGATILAAILAARAVGDFRLVGFFKRAGEGRFAELDTFVYSPLCLALASSILVILATAGGAPAGEIST